MAKMKNGIRPTASGRYEAHYRDPDGRKRTKTLNTKTQARQFLASVKTDVLRGEFIDPNLGKTKFSDWADRWYATTTGRKPKTRYGYQDLLDNLVLPTFGRRQLRTIRPIDVEEWVASLVGDGLSASRIRQGYRVLAMVMRSADENDYIAKTPCTRAVSRKLPKEEPREMLYLNAEEVARLADAMGEYRLLVLFLAYTGLRWGEAAALRRRRLDLLRSRVVVAESVADVGGHLKYGPTKTYRDREVPLPAFLRDELAELLTELPDEPDGFVFTAPRGGPLRVNNWRKRRWDPAVEEAGLPSALRIHDLRHTCAALHIANGAHPKMIQVCLGHSSIAVTMDRYGHLFPDDLDKLAAGLDATYRAAEPAPRGDLVAIASFHP